MACEGVGSREWGIVAYLSSCRVVDEAVSRPWRRLASLVLLACVGQSRRQLGGRISTTRRSPACSRRFAAARASATPPASLCIPQERSYRAFMSVPASRMGVRATYHNVASIILETPRMPPAVWGSRKMRDRRRFGAFCMSVRIETDNQVESVATHLNDPENLLEYASVAQ